MNKDSDEYDIERIGYLWYDYGCSHTDPSYVRFLAHWMAFNWIYSQYSGKKEIDKIDIFLDRYHKVLEENTDFNNHMYEPFLKEKVLDMKNKGNYWPNKNFKALTESQNMEERIRALFMTMYQVRCNLFHGQKNPNSSRDRELVEATAIVLEHYLGVINPYK